MRRNSELFRSLMTEAGFELLEGSHPIIPVMFPGDDGATPAHLAEALRAMGRADLIGPRPDQLVPFSPRTRVAAAIALR